ncbi:hypothetical protein D9757_001621 [Collybiopsis confluens]|uniref:YEATS domain-containing protein n=1 Tax=Collybiopsis confluens TaxID=2823264 RepID=A0A8H5MEP7_9AGAR|nr:hypothetical protein D9757_001621 [Collybiopsis confluens]
MHPNKRIKLDTADDSDGTRNAIILSEIDIELGLRKRLAQTFESRIAWATFLLQSLQNETEYSNQIPFKDVALSALESLEAPSDILFAHILPLPTQNNVSKGRLPPKEKPITRSQKSKFLYLRSQGSSQILLLRCCICHQSSFSSLQGLYNHARLLHDKEWGSHEECIKSCAIPHHNYDAELDLEAGVDVGRSVTLPSVQSLFQMAVEGTRDQSSSMEEADGTENATQRSVLLTQTLGLHSDSPALAQFLGKEVKRKSIKVWDDGQTIDIDVVDDNTFPKLPWKVPLAHRHKSKLAEQFIANEQPSRTVTSTSRSPIICLVVLPNDLYPDQRLPGKHDHTHQWMISAESASYSLNLTTVLKSMTVTVTHSFDSAPFTSFAPLVANEPPFLVVGTTSEPFQAHVELMFNPSTSGPGQNGQKVVLEHWVGLDMIGTSKMPTKGDEQVVDIELDKDTVIQPAKAGYTPVNAKSHWEHIANVASRKAVKTEPEDMSLLTAEVKIPDSYTELLETLSSQYPMTIRDAPSHVSKSASDLPYKLLPGPQQLNALVVGRRKAIEWARAKGIQKAYTVRVQALREREPCDHLISLTTGDVYAWLEDGDHFVRDTEKKSAQVADKVDHAKCDATLPVDYSEGRWCRVCGLGLWAHGGPGLEYIETEARLLAAAQAEAQEKPKLPKIRIKLLDGKVVGGPSAPKPPPRPPPFQCQIVVKMLQLLKMPVIDVRRIFPPRTVKDQEQVTPSASLHLNPWQLPPWSSRTPRLVKDDSTLLSAADPKMTISIHSVIHTFRLPCFISCPSCPSFPVHSMGKNAVELAANLSPHALLALAAKQFIRLLIKEAVEVEKRDKELGVGYLFDTHNRDVSLLASTPATTKKSSKAGNNNVKKGRDREKVKMQSIKVLTPMHIITGVVSSYVRATALASVPTEAGRSSGIDERGDVGIAIFGCLARIGTGLEERKETWDT